MKIGNTKPPVFRIALHPDAVADLLKSGLSEKTVIKARIRTAHTSELLRRNVVEVISDFPDVAVPFDDLVGELHEVDTQHVGIANIVDALKGTTPLELSRSSESESPESKPAEPPQLVNRPESIIDELDLLFSQKTEDYEEKGEDYYEEKVEDYEELNIKPSTNGNGHAKISGTASYTIPYFDIAGNRIPGFYRTKLIPPSVGSAGKPLRYVQPPSELSHAYLPPVVPPSNWLNTNIPLIITEGEKKALAAAQLGYTCLAFGGVDNWHNRIVVIDPKEMVEKNGKLHIKVGSEGAAKQIVDQIVPELVAIPMAYRNVFIIYDTDARPNAGVQRAAFDLALYLEGLGAHPVQVMLPSKQGVKVGLDDFLATEGAEALDQLLSQELRFPTIPIDQLRIWIQKELDHGKNKRIVHRRVARAVLASLDTRGMRYRDKNNTYYYFEGATKHLHSFRWDATTVKNLRTSSLGTLLLLEYGIGTSDTQALEHLADDFTAVEPLHIVRPRYISTTHGDIMYYQLSNSRVAKVSADEVTFCDNGIDGMLFIRGEVVALDEKKLRVAVDTIGEGPIYNLWKHAFEDFNIHPMNMLSIEQTRLLLSCIYYLSPWIRRWRGLMLPFELTEAEPSSG